jgi:hypothetical protein
MCALLRNACIQVNRIIFYAQQPASCMFWLSAPDSEANKETHQPRGLESVHITLMQSMCMEHMRLFWCAENASWATCKTNVGLLALLQHACCLALLQYVTCILPCNATSCGLCTALWKACKLWPLCVVRSHRACCLPDTLPECVSSSPVSTEDCWKMHVMCQVTLQSSLSLFELWLMAIGWWNKINQCRKLKLNLTQIWGVCMSLDSGMHWSQNLW